jgi:hypothetical protein
MERAGKSYPAFSGEYVAPAHKSSTIRGSFMSDESVGVEYGLSERKDFDSEVSSDFHIHEGVNAISGNPRQSIGKKTSYGVSSKGHSFDVGA